MDVSDFMDKDDHLSIGNIQFTSLGVISSFFDKTNLVSFVDELLPKNRVHNVTHGECFKLLTLSTFCKTRRALYKLCENLADIPIFSFFHREIDINDFNDDVLAKFFEAIHNYGTSAFFLRIVQHLAPQLPNLLHFDVLHTDITNFTVYGKYEYADVDDIAENIIKIVLGHPKDKRFHLKCLSLALISNSLGVPVFMRELSGNCSDNKELNKIMRTFCNSIKDSINTDTIPLYIADAAFYSKDNIFDFPANYLTRVPETNTDSRNLIYSDIELQTMLHDSRYSFYETKSSYGGVEQTWLLVHSTEMAEKQNATLERKLKKLMSSANGALKVLEKRAFSCQEDAEREAKIWISKQKMCQFDTVEIISIERRAEGKKGRPKVGEKLEKNFFIRGTLIFDSEAVNRERLGVGRFILATNNLTLSAEEILTNYKNQAKVEKCFRHLKGKEMRISEILLKKPERIQGLCCFMSLVMLISSLLELKLRNGLKEKEKTISDNLGKPTSNPTLHLAFQLLETISGEIMYDKTIQQFYMQVRVVKSPEIIDILEQFGQEVLNMYLTDKIILSQTSLERFIYNYCKKNKLKIS
ncbi:MAG: IS1634 family transposase [Deltaproteobacteria bacterium]|jgi:transposase|nr:IS1634 family transposase [Deltaproteobacteria bacterium]